MPRGSSLSPRQGSGGKGGNGGAKVEGVPLGGEATVAMLPYLLDHGGGGGTYLPCSDDWG